MMTRALVGATFAAVALSGARADDKPVRIGFVNGFSGALGLIGSSGYDAFMLQVEANGGKLGNLPVEVIKQDDQSKPDVGLQAVNRLLEQDKVDIMVGPAITNVLLAAYQPVLAAKVILISPVAGPADLAGKSCSKYFFATSWQNSDTAASMGQYMQDKGVKNVYIQAPNFEGGKEVVAGVKRYYKGTVVKEVYTPLSQQDFSAELTQIRAAAPEAVFAFYPGNLAVNFVKQYAQAGLTKRFPLYTASTIDGTTLPGMGDAPVNLFQTANWNTDLPNEANRDFVAKFRAKYKYDPSFYAAYAYDTARLLDAALRTAGGAADRDKLIAAMEKADFASVRGNFKFGPNHFPVQDFYVLQTVKQADGKVEQVTRGKVWDMHADDNVGQCPASH